MGRMRKNLKEAIEALIECGMVSMYQYPFGVDDSFDFEDVKEAYDWLVKKAGL
jgi:hypothetical protein